MSARNRATPGNARAAGKLDEDGLCCTGAAAQGGHTQSPLQYVTLQLAHVIAGQALDIVDAEMNRRDGMA